MTSLNSHRKLLKFSTIWEIILSVLRTQSRSVRDIALSSFDTNPTNVQIRPEDNVHQHSPQNGGGSAYPTWTYPRRFWQFKGTYIPVCASCLQAGELGLLEESLVKLCLEYSESLDEEVALSEDLEESQSLLCSLVKGILDHFCWSSK